jgi:GNAT superfamily N-acetyltransferase
MQITESSQDWKQWLETLDGMLDQHAAEQGVPFECPQLVLLARDDDGDLLGGLRGFFVQGRFALEELAVVKAARHSGVGRKLMRAMEEAAVRGGARSVYLGTWEFQAPAFYELLGYAEIGRLPPMPGYPAKIWYSKTIGEALTS